jgi:mono/diheme cytochrome c family protein
MPNDTDWIIGPTAAACSSCHNSDLAEAHMDQNGGAVLWNRSEWQAEEPYETCALCHGDGGIAAVSDVHGL